MKKLTYNKDDLVKKMSQKLLFSHEDMKFMVDNFLETILEILKQPKDIIRIEFVIDGNEINKLNKVDIECVQLHNLDQA